MKNIGMVSEKNVSKNTLKPSSKSHQHSYFAPEVLTGLNQERAKFWFW